MTSGTNVTYCAHVHRCLRASCAARQKGSKFASSIVASFGKPGIQPCGELCSQREGASSTVASCGKPGMRPNRAGSCACLPESRGKTLFNSAAQAAIRTAIEFWWRGEPKEKAKTVCCELSSSLAHRRQIASGPLQPTLQLVVLLPATLRALLFFYSPKRPSEYF